jgi:hypothetical protein
MICSESGVPGSFEGAGLRSRIVHPLTAMMRSPCRLTPPLLRLEALPHLGVDLVQECPQGQDRTLPIAGEEFEGSQRDSRAGAVLPANVSDSSCVTLTNATHCRLPSTTSPRAL